MTIPRDLIMELMGGLGRQADQLDPTQLRRFLEGQGANNQYLDIGPYNAYLRRSSPRVVGRGQTLNRPVDLGAIERTDLKMNEEAMKFQPAGRRPPKGQFKEMMALLEEEANKQGYDSVYVEQIFNEFLPDVLKSMGYTSDETLMKGNMPAMFKRLGMAQSGDAWRR